MSLMDDFPCEEYKHITIACLTVTVISAEVMEAIANGYKGISTYTWIDEDLKYQLEGRGFRVFRHAGLVSENVDVDWGRTYEYDTKTYVEYIAPKKARIKSTGEIIMARQGVDNYENWYDENAPRHFKASELDFYNVYEITETVIKGWVAKDKDGETTIHKNYPERRECYWWSDENNCQEDYNLDSDLFPDLKWEDEPLEVELIIKTKK